MPRFIHKGDDDDSKNKKSNAATMTTSTMPTMPKAMPWSSSTSTMSFFKKKISSQFFPNDSTNDTKNTTSSKY